MIKTYVKYIFKEVAPFLRLLAYLGTHPQYIRYILLYGGRKRDSLDRNIPWITFPSLVWLKRNLNKNMTVFEWGSGGSTIFFAGRVAEIISIEDNVEWYKKTLEKLDENRTTNCKYLLCEIPKPDDLQDKSGYSASIRKYPDDYFDMILVDGKQRTQCIEESVNKLKTGGYLVLDNAERENYHATVNLFLGSWKRKDFYGPGPHNHYFWMTSVFTKPAT